MRQNTPHDTDPIHSIDHVPKTCWTCLNWDGGESENHRCTLYPGEFIKTNDPCRRYQLWEEWLYVEWLFPKKESKKR